MDIITLGRAKKYAKALIETLGGDVSDLQEDLESLDSDLLIVNQDGDVASKIIINTLRQHIWQNEADAPVCENGTVTLTNTQKFPFNNSRATIALTKTQKNLRYVVIVECDTAAGNIGEITVSDKQVNGFKLGFSGGAKTAAVKYYVIGGIIK